MPYLVREEVQALLDTPDPATRDGIRDRAMLHLAVCAGLRVSELIGLRTGDVTLPSMSIRVLGKGRRERVLPLWKTTASALRAWLSIRGTVAAPEVFISSRGEPLSRWGFAYVLKQHVETAAHRCPGLQTPLIYQTGPKTSAKSGWSCSMREKRCISGRSLPSGIMGIRS